MSTATRFKVGVDIGGTFTDVTIVSEHDGQVTTHKTPSTPQALEEGVLRGVAAGVAKARLDPAGCTTFVHGSTVGVNTIIQRAGARVGVLVTRGFEDLLELGRTKMLDPFSLFTSRPIPLSRRNWVRAVRERVDAQGRVLLPLDEASVLAAAGALLEQGADALAVSFLNAYRNPAHEQSARALIDRAFPGTRVTLSTEVWPQIREYERTTVAVMNSYIGPRITQYIEALERQKQRAGLRCPLYVTGSNGGIVPIGHAAGRPISTLLSGPASGIVASLHLMQASNLPRVVTMDMGGTSADLCVLSGPEIPYAWDQEIEGLPVTLPSVDVSSIGAGGGSIAYADNLGLLRVGPESAGADPGPAAYGKGGQRPTITDAYLVSGLLAPESFLGGELPLYPERAAEALQGLAARLRLTLRETADGILRVATSNLAAEFTRLAAKKGIDPREFALVAFGGAGPTHGCFLADEMRIGHIAIPYSPGTFCAMGSVLADFRLDYVKTLFTALDKVDPDELEAWFREVEAKGRESLREAEPDIAAIQVIRIADMRYLGQGYEVAIPFTRLADLPERFGSEYRKLYGPRNDEAPVEIINVRAIVVGLTRKTPFRWTGEAAGRPASGERRIDVAGAQYACPVYARPGMPPGWRAAGPFIVDQPDTTCVVAPGWSGEVDAVGTLHLRKES